ncbi:MAG: hypothetical protein KKG02_03430 [Candidatus Edwardsbacteria bacterium]|nr:hypothetical protein [Candidatus Edwardsbacteria bacterium]MBU2593583.1 hypothetical protein [Candidatus Edwardsbacteria bacterium]
METTKISVLGEEVKITDQQFAVLEYIYKGTFDDSENNVIDILFRVGARKLRKIFEDDAPAIDALENIHLIEKRIIENDEYYYLTPKGLYLCIFPRSDFELVKVYCEIIKMWFNENPDIDIIKSDNIEKGFTERPQPRKLDGQPLLPPLKTKRLWPLVKFLKLYNTIKVSSCDGNNWYCSIPEDIEDLDKKDINSYLLDRYKKEEDDKKQEMTTDIKPEISQVGNTLFFDEVKGVLELIKEPKLRDSIESDLKELGMARDLPVPKIKIIMCGIIVESLLLDILNRRPDIAQTYLQNHNKWPDQASLDKMLYIANKEGLITETSDIVKSIKNHRDLVHPYRAVNTNIIIDDTTSHAIISALRVICRDIQKANDDGKIKEYEEK